MTPLHSSNVTRARRRVLWLWLWFALWLAVIIWVTKRIELL